MTGPRPRGRLFRKYVVVFLILVGGMLIASSLVELYLSYQQTKRAVARLGLEQATAAAERIERFVKDIERQLWATTPAASGDPAVAPSGGNGRAPGRPRTAALTDQRELDFLRLLHSVPAITEIRHLDGSGKEQLRVSRLALDAVGSGEDFSQAPAFRQATSGKTYFSPVYFRNESEPYLTIAVPSVEPLRLSEPSHNPEKPGGSGSSLGAEEPGVSGLSHGPEEKAEVTVAEVNLKAIWDVVSRIRIGRGGYAYVVDSRGLLVAHPDVSLVLQKRDLSALAQVRAAQAGHPTNSADETLVTITGGLEGGQVVSAHASIGALGWLVFAEQPVSDAFAPVYASTIRSAVILVLGLALSVLASVLLARRMVAPIQVLQQGAAQIGAGDLGHRIEIRTGDELESLGGEFNRTAARLQESYASLEQNVEARTRELARTNADLVEALAHLRALGEIGQAVSSTLDLDTVLATMVARATLLSATDAAQISEYDELTEEFRLRAAHHFEDEIIDAVRRTPLRKGEGIVGRMAFLRQPVQIPDIAPASAYESRVRDVLIRFGYHALLAIPLLREEQLIGALVVGRKIPGEFSADTVGLLTTFAAQSALAIHNARLYAETKRREWEATKLYEVTRQLTSSLDPDRVLDVITAKAVELLGCDASGLYTYDAARGGLAFFRGVNLDPDLTRNLVLGPGQGVAGQAFQERRPVWTRDQRVDPSLRHTPQSDAPVRAKAPTAYLAVPIHSRGEVYGVLLECFYEPHDFSRPEVQLLSALADHAAIALENARLFKELAARNLELTEALEQQTAIAEILRLMIASGTDLQSVLDTIAGSVVKLCRGSFSTVCHFDGELVHLVAHHNHPPAALETMRRQYPCPPGPDTLTGRAILERAVVHVPDVESDPRVSPYTRAVARAAGFRGTIAMPMLREGQPAGVIGVSRAEPVPFSDKQIDLLRTLANQAMIAIENVRLFQELQARNRELTEALTRQTATAEILRVINSSPTDIGPVFDAIAEGALRLCDGLLSAVYRLDGDRIHLITHRNMSAEGIEEFRRAYPLPVSAESLVAQTIRDGTIVHLSDAQDDPGLPSLARRIARAAGYRGLLLVPMLREGAAVGAIGVARREATRFSETQLELLGTFADQAVIAMENLRLFTALEARNSELTDALEQQTAIAGVLRVISQSPADLQPVFDTIARDALRLCGASNSAVLTFDGELIHIAALHNVTAEGADALRRLYPVPPSGATATTRAILNRAVVHISDVRTDLEYGLRAAAQAADVRSVVSVPMLREGSPIGAITLTRSEAGTFTDKQIVLVRTFADQAVIAVESARLFQELAARNSELTDALEQQTAMAGVLRVISSSPTDLQPVYRTILSNVTRLCDASFAALYLYDGEVLTTAAYQNASPALVEHLRQFRQPPGRQTATRRAALEQRPVHIHDVLADAEYTALSAFVGEGLRTVLSVPMLRESTLVGVITTWRREVKPFTEKQIALVKTFADQAVIAIGSARLFHELEARNRELAEALTRQTATNEVLSVMSRSTFDLEPVLETIVENGTRLCGAELGFVYRFDGEVFRLVAAHGVPTEFKEFRLRNPIRPGRGSVTGRTALEGRTVHIHDVRADAEYDLRGPGQRTVLGVPMFKEGALIGVITWAKTRVEPFTDEQIELVTSFADQAAIAIEHVRLFQELEARTRELTRSVEELRALGEVGEAVGSTLDLQTVLTTIVARAVELSGSHGGTIHEFDETTQVFHVRATHQVTEELLEAVRAAPIRLGEGAMGRAAATRATVQVPDILDEREPVAPQSRPILARLGFRSLLAIPLRREDRLLGGLAVWRKERGNFPSGVVSLLETFAAQSVLAIQNARLFEEVREKSRELEVLSRNLERLYRISTALQEPLSLREQLHRVLENAREVVGVDRFYAWVVAPDGDKIVNLVGAGMSKAELEQFEGHEIPLAEAGALHQAYRDGVPLVFTEQNPLPPQFRLDPKYLIPPLRTTRFVVVPMVARGATVGLLVGDNKPSRRPILPPAVDLLQTFASHAAVAIANARLFQAIEDKSRQLEVATRAKSQFLANMSHELRTPLNAILGYTELITDSVYGEVPEKIQEVLQRVQESGRHLLGLINDVLDLSKIEAGQLTLTLADYSMDEIVQSVSGAVNALAAGKNLELVTAVPPDLPLGRGDARRLTQVLLNLVGNAIKFTDVGQVATRVRVSDGSFMVSVADTGPGIAPADQQKIFDEFQQVDSSDTRKGGSGLGLAIARRIIEMHGGQLWVESMPGQGSTFWFTVPIRVEQPVAPVRSVVS